MIRTARLVLALAALCLASCANRPADPPAAAISTAVPAAPPATLAQWAAGAQLFDGLGTFHRKASTDSDLAQAYFDQGMRFLWAFNHDEATRSFAEAAELDPQCAICYWGVALTVGPNYNLPKMAEQRAKVAWEAMQLAQAHAAHATPVEQALIDALASRYQGAQALDPSNEAPVLIAYAHAMQAVTRRFPDDNDVQVLTAEAMMNTHAWELWTLDGAPAPGTLEVIARLDGVLVKDRLHPGANHYYIHALEASPHPEQALPEAERLRGMMPAAGHMEHMPAHIFQRVGRYADAAEANRRGAAADLAYFARTWPLDYYAGYTAHNYLFLAFSTVMQGRRAETLGAARKARAVVPDEQLLETPGSDWRMTELYAAMVRFGMWDAILAEPAPNAKLTGLTGGYLYARSIALAATGRVADAGQSLAGLEKLATATTTNRHVFAIAILVARARIASAGRDDDQAIALLTEAVTREDRLGYAEPAQWFFPVRHVLGAALLRKGRATEAEAVYREDLRRNPENGWALCGLALSLKAQKRDAEARAAQRRFQVAWKDADITITASAF